jgi:dTDP-4-dehydrorhamnose reductase
MKILITGSRGQVGSQLINILNKGRSEIGENSYQVRNAEFIGKTSKELDISNFDEVCSVFYKIMPDVVINAAAYTNVDGCETNADLAFRVNAYGARNLALACEEIGAKLVHISTDYVFSGEGNKAFNEGDIPAPRSVYGKSKITGDNFVREFSSKHFIVRPSWVYGYSGKNFVYTIMNTGRDKDSLKVVNDQRGNPTNAEDLCHHILKLISTEKYGVYHCAGHGDCTWYEFACKIIELAKIQCTITPCSTYEYPTPTKRPTYSSLDNARLRSTVGDEMRNWEEALKAFIGKVV